MTSAAVLFYVRRSRYGGRHVNSNLELEEIDSSSSERSFHHRRHHSNSSTRRDILAGCDPLRRRSSSAAAPPLPRPHHRQHQQQLLQPSPPPPPPNSERDITRVDEGSGQFSLSNSSISLDNFGGIGNRGRRDNGNDRLPGAVLLARERLIERLRGVSLSANRQSNRTVSHSNRNGLTIGDDYGLVDATEDYWDTETLREALARDHLFADSIFQSDQLSVTQATRSESRPPGLTQDALARLQLEVFTKSHSGDDEEKTILKSSQECSICLESFAEDDGLIRLPCAHRFHFVCLDPWVRICGDCPYCRREIVLSSN